MKNREHEPEDEQQRPDSLSSSSNLVGTLLDQKMEVRKIIGEGGNGVVYEAFHRLLEKTVAVKILNKVPEQSSDSSLRFKNEAQVLSTFDHENIVQFLAFSSLPDGRNYMVLERLKGETLAEKLKKNGPLKQEDAIPIFIKICKALEYAHEKHIIHRDLKPANIMLLEEPDERIAKLLDFGIFKALQSSNQNLTQTGVMLGTVNYMSPEQCSEKELDQRSDIYSLACVMYEAMVGTPPMEDANELATMHNHVNKPLLSVPAKYGISKKFADCILRCCEKDRTKRFQTASELLIALEACSNSSGESDSRKVLEKKWFWSIVAVGLIMGLITLSALHFGKAPEKVELKDRARYFSESSDISNDKLFEQANSFLISNASNKTIAPLKLAKIAQKCLQYNITVKKQNDAGYSKRAVFQNILNRLSQTHLADPKSELERLSYLALLSSWISNYDDTIKYLRLISKTIEKEPELMPMLRDNILACEDVFGLTKRSDNARKLNEYLVSITQNDNVGRALALTRELLFHTEYSSEKRKAIALQAANSLRRAFEKEEFINVSRLAEFCRLIRQDISANEMLEITGFMYGDLPTEKSDFYSNESVNLMSYRVNAFIENNEPQKALQYATALTRAVRLNELKPDLRDQVEIIYLTALKSGAANRKETVLKEGLTYLSRIDAEDTKYFLPSSKALIPVLYPVEYSHQRLWTTIGPLLSNHLNSEPEESAALLLQLVRDFQNNTGSKAQREQTRVLELLDQNIDRAKFSNAHICEVYTYLAIKFPDRAQNYIDKACKKTSADEFLNKVFELCHKLKTKNKALSRDYLRVARIAMDSHHELSKREPEYQKLEKEAESAEAADNENE